MDVCPCPESLREAQLKRKEHILDLKEKKLLKKQKKLQRELKEYKKRRNSKAKSDLKAAATLNQARKRLQLAADLTNKIDKRNCRKNKCDNCVPSQKNWLQKINSMMQKFYSNSGSCFCQRRREFNEICELYFKKIMRSKCPCEELSTRGSEAKRYSCHELPCRSRRYNSLESAAGDCYEMAMGRTPNTWSCHPWPVFYPRRLDFRTQCRNLGLCCMFIASFLFWTPCILYLLLCKCLCYSCCSDC